MINRLASSSSARNRRFVLRLGIVAGMLLVLPSCCIPNLQRAEPGAPMPETFNGTTSPDNSAQIGWREFFNDPTLVDLIDQAMAGNQELKILDQRVQAANYEVLSRRGEYLPFVNFGARANLEKPSEFSPLGAEIQDLEPIPGVNFPNPLPTFLIAADVSWQVDIWRKLRNARDAAALRYLATADGRNYVVTRMVAEVAERYYELMALDNQLATVDRTIQIFEQSLEIARAKKAAGRGTELGVQRFLAEVRKFQSERLLIQQRIIQVENQINFTLGRFPQHVERNSAGFIDLNLRALSLGVPAQLLQNRPDIRQAERELAAAGLDVRVARARFFPSLDLFAGVGVEAFNTRYLLMTPESLIYNTAGDLVAPLINKRAIRAEYLSANAMQLEAVYEYQRTVLNAVIEVVNRINKVENFGRSIDVKRQQLKSLETSVDVARQLFQSARTEYIEVLLAQRDLQEATIVLIETKQQQLAAIVNTYQALGGGALRPGECRYNSAYNRKTPAGQPQQTPAWPQPEAVPPGPELLPGPELPSPDLTDSRRGRSGIQHLPPVEPPVNTGLFAAPAYAKTAGSFDNSESSKVQATSWNAPVR